MNKDQKELLEQEVEDVITEEEVYEEVVQIEGKFNRFFKAILSGFLDQVLAVGIALILFLVFDLILGVMGYEIAMREEVFLIVYIITNVLYYPISQEILKGKTIGKKIILK